MWTAAGTFVLAAILGFIAVRMIHPETETTAPATERPTRADTRTKRWQAGDIDR